MEVDPTTVDHQLQVVIEELVRTKGPVELEWLLARVRRARRDARLDEDALKDAICMNTLLVWRPGGEVDHMIRALHDTILTQRVRARLDGRTDLWSTVSLQPFLNLASFAPLRLASGGEVRRAPSGDDVLVGPSGWLPDVPAYGVIGLRMEDERLSVEVVDESDFPPLEQQQRVRELMAHHYRIERWYAGEDDLASRPGEMVRAFVHAKLEVPDLLSQPYPPLEELLSMHLEGDHDRHYWRDFSAQQNGTCSFYINGMPEALNMELGARARQYGMSYDQYVIAVLSHLAWRTPFAEDMEPWEQWLPEHRPAATLTALPSADEATEA